MNNLEFTFKRSEQVLLLVLVLFCLLITLNRNHVWHTKLQLWSDVSSKSPLKARPYINIGTAYIALGQYEEALESLSKARKADPWYIEVYYNEAIVYIRTGRYFMAIPKFEEVLRINEVLKGGHYGAVVSPKFEVEANSNLGNIYNIARNYNKSIHHFNVALKLKPEDTATRFNLALTLKRVGKIEEAKKEFNEILKYDPNDKEAAFNLTILGGTSSGGDIK